MNTFIDLIIAVVMFPITLMMDILGGSKPKE
jgi:hypothetical protein